MINLDEIKKRADAAREEVYKVAKNPSRWRMCIPARPDDSDTVICNSLEDIDQLVAIIEKINTPEIKDFLSAVENEAKHQRLRWPSEHDAGKTSPDWFWLIGYVAGKAINATKSEKILHHIITTAAVCLNWHSARLKLTDMRPGIDRPEESL